MKSFRKFISESHYQDMDARSRGILSAVEQDRIAKHPVYNAQEIASRTRRLKFGGVKNNEAGLSMALRDAQAHDKKFNTGGKLEHHVRELMSGNATSKFPYDEKDEKDWNHHQAMEHIGSLKEHPVYKKLFHNPSSVRHWEHMGTTTTEIDTPTHRLELHHSGFRGPDERALHTVRLWKHHEGKMEFLGQHVSNGTPYEVGEHMFKKV